MNSIEPKNNFLSRYLWLLLSGLLIVLVSYLKFKTIWGGFLIFIVFLLITILKKTSNKYVNKIVFNGNELIEVSIVENKMKRQIVLKNDKPHFEFISRNSGKTLRNHYSIILNINDAEKIELTGIQGWGHKDLISFFSKNGILFNIT